MKQLQTRFCLTLLAGMFFTVSSLAQEMVNDETPVAPEPGSLQADWWSNFGGSRAVIEPRVDAFLTNISGQISNLDAQNQQLALSAFEAVSENFGAYLNLLENTDVAMPAQQPPAAGYLLDDLLDLAAVAREARMGATEEEFEVEREERIFAGTSSRRDAAFKKYVGSTAGDDRWLAGLDLVQTRLAQAMSARRLELLTERSESADEYAAATEARVDLAQDLLTPAASDSALDEIGQLRNDDSAALDDARRELRAAQVTASVLALDTVQGRSQQRLQQQTLLEAEVDVAVAEVKLAQSDSRYWWTALKLEAPTDLTTLESQALAWSELVRSVEQRSPEWKRGTEDELLAVQSLNRTDFNREATRLLDQRQQTAQQTLSKVGELDAAVADLGLLTQVVDDGVTDYSGVIRSWFAGLVRGAKTLYLRILDLSKTTLFSVGETPVTGGDILRVFIIMAVAMLLSRILRVAIRRVGESEYSGTQASMYTVGRLSHYAIIILAVVISLTSIGLDFTNLALVFGALGVGIGFGLQSIVSNFVSGLIILFEHSLRVGDYIELDTGLTGTVKAINVRSTLINTNDNIDIVVPNSEFVTTRLKNWTLGERILRVRIPFGVAYGSDKELVRKAAMEAAAEVSYTLTNMKGRETDVWLVEFGDNSLNFLLLVWVNRQGAKRPTRTRAAYLWALETTLTKYGIEIPFPQRDLHLRSGWPSELGDDKPNPADDRQVKLDLSDPIDRA